MKSIFTFFFALVVSTCVFGQLENVPEICPNLPRDQKTVIAVSDFDISARGAGHQSSAALKDMLSNALFGTGCFRIVERAKLSSVTNEQNIGMSGAFNTRTTAKTGKLQGAQVLVIGNITEFKEKESGGALGFITRKAGVAAATMKAHVGFVIKLLDANTGEMLDSKSFDKKVTKVGIAGGGLLGVVAGGAFFKSQAMADAIEEAIIDASKYIADARSNLPGAIDESQFEPRIKSPADCAAVQGRNIPTVMVMIPEYHITRKIPDPAGETAILKKFVEIGYNVLDPSQVVALRNSNELEEGMDNPAKAAELGRRFGADVIIIGEAFSESAPDFNGMKSCRARVEARAIETATGRILATDGTHAGGVDRSENVAAKTALKNAGEMIADYFLDQMCSRNIHVDPSKMRSPQGNGISTNRNGNKSMDVVLRDVNFIGYRKLQKHLKAHSWITILDQSYKNKTARMKIEFSKTADDIVDFLINANGTKFEVTDFSEGKIIASAVN